MKSELANRPPIDVSEREDGGERRGRAQILVVLDRVLPTAPCLGQVAWFARRLNADVVVGGIVIRSRRLDELDQVRQRISEEAVRETCRKLLEQGVRATGEVRAARQGGESAAAIDVADMLDANLIIVPARRGSWLGLFPGSPVARTLQSAQRRPVMVIPDRAPRRPWRQRFRDLIGAPDPGSS